MAPRPTRGRTVGAHTRVGEIRAILWSARVAWASKGAHIPLGLLQGSGLTPPCLSRTRPAARSGQASAAQRISGARSPEGAGRARLGRERGAGRRPRL